jgi:hypothetical protein
MIYGAHSIQEGLAYAVEVLAIYEGVTLQLQVADDNIFGNRKVREKIEFLKDDRNPEPLGV